MTVRRKDQLNVYSKRACGFIYFNALPMIDFVVGTRGAKGSQGSSLSVMAMGQQTYILLPGRDKMKGKAGMRRIDAKPLLLAAELSTRSPVVVRTSLIQIHTRAVLGKKKGFSKPTPKSAHYYLPTRLLADMA